MGGNWSSLEREPSPDPWWPAPRVASDICTTDQDVQQQEAAETTQEVKESHRGQVRQEELESFKQELARKRALRHEALAALQSELQDLKSRAAQSEELKRELEEQREENRKLSLEREKLMEEVEHKAALEKQIQALKDVSEIGKEMLRIRELQVKELKKKLVEINISSVTAPPEDLRLEYETQIENIRKLRTLYEERAAATLLEHRRQLEREEARITVLETKLSELQKETDEYKEAKKELEGKIEKLESTIQINEDELIATKDKLFSTSVQNKSLNSQMKLINNLFSQMLVSPKVDLDRLIRLLKENHGLITDLTEKGDSNEVAALLVDLAGQVEKEKEEEKKSEPISFNNTTEKSLEEINENLNGDNTLSEISSNLSKVWKVMIELLSHHQNSSETEISGGAESCYKSIQTPSGPRSVISVSQTFITLKDLILEKNRLVKEVGRLKTLNSHLEHRLGSQEKRLIVVTSELRKTWGVVNKLKAQHKQLHTHEKILRYELQQKRCMLNELKLELDHCRDKWEQARQKNSQTEEDWKKLRKEFAARKSRKESNSAESGYEEDDLAQSPPSEPIGGSDNLFAIRQNIEGSETELSEEDMEHSDGNSFDTVIDLLDIACIQNQADNESATPFVLDEAPSETPELSPSLLPLSGSEFTEGLDQIESEDLAAVLDVQYQNQLLGADYNLSLPSSSGSSPIPTENDEFASSEMDISEEDSSSNDNHIYSTPLTVTNQTVSEDQLLFGSNSSTNISKFLEGLFTESESNRNKMVTQPNLNLNVPSTSQRDDNDSTTPIVNNENCYQFPSITEAEIKNTTELIHQRKNSTEGVLSQTPNTEHSSNCQPKPSSSENSSMKFESLATSSNQSASSDMQEDSLRAREERLKKLEKQCRSLVSKVMSTSFRSEVLSNKLHEIQQFNGSPEEGQNVTDDKAAELKNIEPLLPHCVAQLSGNSCNEASAMTPGLVSIDQISENHQETMNESETENILKPLFQEDITSEETLEVKAARLKRLEDQCKSLFTKMSASSSRSQSIPNKQNERQDSTMSSQSMASHQSDVLKIDSSTPSQAKVMCYNTFELKSENGQNMERLTREGKPSERLDLDSESRAILRKFSAAVPPPETATNSNCNSKKNRTPEQILEARAERFKRLEEQCKSLVSKMTATSLRSEIISNKLDELHNCYGTTENISGNDELPSSSTESRSRHSPCLSPRHNRRKGNSLGSENSKDELVVLASIPSRDEGVEERLNFTQTTPQPEINGPSTSDNTSGYRKTPEEILQGRAQRLNRLEEQCKSLFSKMAATSQRSNVISNKLEELHEQYGQPSTSENSENNNSTSTSVSTVDTTECQTITDRKSSHPHTSGVDQMERRSDPSTDPKTDGKE